MDILKSTFNIYETGFRENNIIQADYPQFNIEIGYCVTPVADPRDAIPRIIS
jgi:hypothetical protein